MKDNYIYKYDDNKGQFILATKNELLSSISKNQRFFDIVGVKLKIFDF